MLLRVVGGRIATSPRAVCGRLRSRWAHVYAPVAVGAHRGSLGTPRCWVRQSAICTRPTVGCRRTACLRPDRV